MFDQSIFAARRQRVMDLIGPTAVLMVASLPLRLRNADAHYSFRQHSDVSYLTGFSEEQTVLLLRPNSSEKSVMFVRPRDPEMETWDGKRAGIEGVCAKFGADVAYPITELSARLPSLISGCDELHFALGLDDKLDLLVCQTIAQLRNKEKRGQRPPRCVVDLRHSLHEMRLHKDLQEITVMQRAAAITSQAHVAAMKLGRPGRGEHEIEAEIAYVFRRSGGTGPGYSSIVGSGDNATILHYVDNSSSIANGALVLVDAGCEYQGYTADVTRTWPANGTFSEPQRRVYQAVLKTQINAINMVKPGVTIEKIHQECVRSLTASMIELGLLSGSVDDRIADLAYKQFYMHGTSHWLGMDVHDVGMYTQGGVARPLAPGMVITIEPGLYIAREALGVPDEFRGIGVRIEDDILVTENAYLNLTETCPKTIEQIEALCRAT
jgi:Xaa-Pro aminopeptidase